MSFTIALVLNVMGVSKSVDGRMVFVVGRETGLMVCTCTTAQGE